MRNISEWIQLIVDETRASVADRPDSATYAYELGRVLHALETVLEGAQRVGETDGHSAEYWRGRCGKCERHFAATAAALRQIADTVASDNEVAAEGIRAIADELAALAK